MVQTLVVRHVDGSDPPRFEVGRLSGTQFKTCPAVAIDPPQSRTVGGGVKPLTYELRWYLEQFLEYPFSPETEHANDVLAALRQWGRDAFQALFHSGQARDFYRDALRDGLENLLLQISSDDPQILGWPWEALEDPEGQRLAPTCRLERRLNRPHDPVALSDRLPRERVEVLLVTCRPYEADVGYRSISRPLVDLIRTQNLPARVTLLRPPTLEHLRNHLRAHPHRYHVLHFDGHGVYGADVSQTAGQGGAPLAGPNAPHMLRGPGRQGYLAFEDAQGAADLIPAETLATLLYEHRLPAVVLNACQSAMIDADANSVFASVSGALLKGGVRSVTAMAYALYVSGAQQFLPAFYRRLFEVGEFSEAARAGRQQMLQDPQRVCARGRYPLEDWLVPVLYEQGELDLSFAKTAVAEPVDRSSLPQLSLPYGFIGRDGAILQLERALHRPAPVLLVTGLGGVGKTTLAYGFAEWLIDTQGLDGVLAWQDFRGIRAAESVLNRLGETFFGSQFSLAPLPDRLAALAKVLKEHRSLLVWDNFEVVHGIPGTTLEPQLPEADRGLLRDFVKSLAGGKTKIIITSRSDEPWLAKHERFKLPIVGLRGEERWDYCDAVLRSLGKSINRKDADLVKLLDLLQGHPLAMRVILPELEAQLAGSLVAALTADVSRFSIGEDGTDERGLFATLKFALDALPARLRPLLVPLALHAEYIDGDDLEAMAQQVEGTWDRRTLDQFLQTLCGLGLLSDRGRAIYELHPLVTRYLQQRADCRPEDAGHEPWVRAFVDVMGSLAGAATPRPLHEQRGLFFRHTENFHTALQQAERLQMAEHVGALLQSLGAFVQNERNWPAAVRWFERCADFELNRGREDQAAVPYHQLGMIAQEQRDFVAAEQWCRKSLEINVRLGNEQHAARTYHRLGMIAQEQRDFVAADEWYCKSLEINVRRGDEHGAAMTYHHLGMIAQEQRDFVAADEWYRQSLEIKERLADEHGAARTYHQLGFIADEQRDFVAAGGWYRKSLEINERLGDMHIVARTYHHLGMIAQEQRHFALAEQWYRKSLEIKERLCDEHSAASTYHHLGMIAQEQRDCEAAEKWYRKALEINGRLGDAYIAASTYVQLANLAQLQQEWIAAAQWYIKAAIIFRSQSPHYLQQTIRNFGIALSLADPASQQQMRALWNAAELPPLPEGGEGT